MTNYEKYKTEYQEPKVDWANVPIDTPILVWDDPDNLFDIDDMDDIKKQRYFAGYFDGKIYAWVNGTTSWTAIDKTDWKHAELANIERE